MSKTVGVQEAAILIGITRQAVHQAIQRGDLKSTLESFGGYKFHKIALSEISRFRKARQNK